MKQLVRTTLGRLGYSVASTAHLAARYLEHPPRTAFESVLLRRFSGLEGLTFVQVGANDGHRCDPLRAFIARHGWSGVMLEPLPDYFRALAALHGSNPRITLLEAALHAGGANGTCAIFRLASTDGLPDWAHGVASLDRNRVEQVARELHLPQAAIVAQEVATTTWGDVWARLPGRRCDILVLDTEGHDVPLLRAADLAARRPRVVHFEHACATTGDRLAIYGELLALGYELATDGPDTTAWLPGDGEAQP